MFMKRTIKAIIGCGLLLAATQSYGQVMIGDTTGVAGDAAWKRLTWFESDVQAGNVFAWNADDLVRDNDVNDVFRVTVNNGFTGMLDVVDIGVDNDRYEVLDFNNSLASLGSTGAYADLNTSSSAGALSPDFTFADGDWSQGTIGLAAGTHDFKVAWIDTPADQVTNGSVYVRFTQQVIPEPSSALLGLLGLGFCVLRRRR